MTPDTRDVLQPHTPSRREHAPATPPPVRNRGALEARLEELSKTNERSALQRPLLVIATCGALFLLGIFQTTFIARSGEETDPLEALILLCGILISLASYTGLLIYFLERRFGRRERLLIETLLHVEQQELDE